MVSLLSVAALISQTEAFLNNPFDSAAKPYPQVTVDDKNVLKYTGWQGPYSDRRGYGINRDTPADTVVDQVVQLTRHAERYPDVYDYKEQAKTFEKILKHQGSLNGSIDFANYWVPYTDIDDPFIAQESLYGPYSGLLHAYSLGVEARRRYYHLYDGQSILPLFTSGYERVVDTARQFGKGFLNWNFTDLAALNIIPETDSQGANTLVPDCPVDTSCSYPSNWTEANAPWLYDVYQTAADRLNKQNPQVKFLKDDIPHLLGAAAFELNVRGSSPWVNVFTSEEWAAFNYAQTSLYYCFYGPASKYGATAGSLFLNATRTLLVNGPEKELPLTFAFAHDTDIINLLAALRIDEEENWDAENVSFGQRYDVTDLTPQGAHIAFERLVYKNGTAEFEEDSKLNGQYPAAFNVSIDPKYGPSSDYKYNLTSGGTAGPHTRGNSTEENIYVRIVLNEAVVPLKNCSNGPGYSCKLSDFNKWVNERLSELPTFLDVCNVPESAPKYLDFFWNYNTTTELNNPEYIYANSTLVDSAGEPIRSSS